MIGLLMGLGLGKRAAQVVGYVVLPLLLLGAFYLALDAYGDSRFRAGVTETDDRWEAAGRKLEAQAAASASAADTTALVRAVDYNAKVAKEKEKLDAAATDGSSPLDVLFGTDGVR